MIVGIGALFQLTLNSETNYISKLKMVSESKEKDIGINLSLNNNVVNNDEVGTLETGNKLALDDSVFDNCYAYSTLDADEKQLYVEMYAAIMNHDAMVRLTTKNADFLENVYYALSADHGEIFWSNGYEYKSYKVRGDLAYINFSPKYTFTEEQRAEYQSEIDTNIKEFMSGVKDDMTDYEKSKYVYETLINEVGYNLQSENNQNIISVFLNRETVCEGYSRAAQYMFNKMGISSFIIAGDANGEPHAWNAVKLDGEWYYFDTTWGNSTYQNGKQSSSKFVNHTYLNITETELLSTRNMYVRFDMPDFSSTTNNYFVKEGTYIEEWNPDVIGLIFSNAWNNGNKSCDIKFKNKYLYDKVIDYFFESGSIYKYCAGLSSCTYFTSKELSVLTVYYDR